MASLAASAGWGAAVAASLLAGASVAAAVALPPRLAAVVTTFGGGVLLGAVAFELAPEADARAGAPLTALALLAGMAVYVGADAWLSRDRAADTMRRSAHAAAAGRAVGPVPGREAARGEAIAAGLFIDGVPESIALGLTVAEGEIGLALLVGILVGNLAEAYGAAQPIVAGGRSRRFAVALLGGIGVVLAAATVAGGTVLADVRAEVVGAAQAVAAGAVLAVVSISIIPHGFADARRLVAAATVVGFVVAYLLT